MNFYQDLTLAAPGYSVTINAQGPQSGASFTGRGGNIDVKGNIVSGTYLVQYPQAQARCASRFWMRSLKIDCV